MLNSNPDYMGTMMRRYRQPNPEATPQNLFPRTSSSTDPSWTSMFSALLAGCLTEPELHNASVHGFKLKPWEFYPTLVPWNAEDTVHGMYWQAEYERQVALLQRYETHIHKTTACSINFEKDKSYIEDGLTFVWAGDPASSELKDGEVLLENYQLYFILDTLKRKA